MHRLKDVFKLILVRLKNPFHQVNKTRKYPLLHYVIQASFYHFQFALTLWHQYPNMNIPYFYSYSWELQGELSLYFFSLIKDDVTKLQHLFLQMESLNDGYDMVDGPAPAKSHTTLEVHAPNSRVDSLDSDPHHAADEKDMLLIDRIVRDDSTSPSKYHSPRKMNSNIPSGATTTLTPRRRPLGGQRDNRAVAATMVVGGNLGATMRMNPKALTPRSNDPLDTRAEKFTEEKPFQPRTLRTNTASKLSQFKYYNAPKKRPESERSEPTVSKTVTMPRGGGRTGRTGTFRSATPMTQATGMTMDSTDLMMNETLMSRDMNHAQTPTGVPRLDISVDQDHMMWLKEQSQKANVRAGHRSRHDSTLSAGMTLRGTNGKMMSQTMTAQREGAPTYFGGTYSGTGQMTGYV